MTLLWKDTKKTFIYLLLLTYLLFQQLNVENLQIELNNVIGIAVAAGRTHILTVY